MFNQNITLANNSCIFCCASLASSLKISEYIFHVVDGLACPTSPEMYSIDIPDTLAKSTNSPIKS